MTKEQQIGSAYGMAKERYAAIGIDTDKAIAILEETPISLHCWQTDDVMGFESQAGLSGGIQATGNYPGRARTIDEVKAELLEAEAAWDDDSQWSTSEEMRAEIKQTFPWANIR